MVKDNKEDRKKTSSNNQSFIQKILSMMLGKDDQNKALRKFLADTRKELKKRSRFYKLKGNMIQPGMASFFYEIYETVSPSIIFFGSFPNTSIIKKRLLEFSMDENTKNLLENLTEESIREKSKTLEMKSLAAWLKNQLMQLYSYFDGNKRKEINYYYNLMLMYQDFVNFDYFFFLKKFDSAVSEHTFTYKPKFEALNINYVMDDLKEFADVSLLVNNTYQWEGFFSLMSKLKDLDLVEKKSWKKMLTALSNMDNQQVLNTIIRYVEESPGYTPKAVFPQEEIIEPYLEKMKTQAEMILQKIARERKDNKIDKLLNKVFGTTAVARTKNYTEKSNIVFEKKMLAGFLYVKPVNYLKAFLLDYFKRDIRALSDVLLVTGKWNEKSQSQGLSAAYYELIDLSDELLKLDDSCADDGEYGSRIKNMILKVGRDQSAKLVLRKLLDEINSKALRIVKSASQNLVILGKHCKITLEDSIQKKPDLITNWKEIESVYTGDDVREDLKSTYERIYFFIQIMQAYLK